VIERTRDIGVLNLLARIRHSLFARCSGVALLCLAGIAGGIALSYGVRAAFIAGFPTLSILITPGWMIRAGLIACSAPSSAASYPAWVASRKDAVEALTFD